MTAKTKHEQSGLEKVFAGILFVVFGGIVLHAPFSVFMSSWLPEYSLLFKSWKELLLFAAAILACVIVTRRHLWRELGRDWLLRLIVIFAALHFVLLGWQFQGTAPALAGLAIDLRYLLFFALVYILIKIWPRYRLSMLIVAAIGAMIVVIFGALQLFLPADILSHLGYGPHTIEPYLTVDKNPNYIRINSTLRGPNSVGAYAVIVLSVIAALFAKTRARITKTPARVIWFIVITICTLVALWISYSRSALLAAVLSLFLVGLAVYGGRISKKVWLACGAVVVVAIIGLFLARNSNFVDNVILHNNPTTGAKVTSNEGHLSSLVHGSERMIHQPLGAGIGSTGSASLYGGSGMIVENQYLFVAHEAGWLGLALFVVIFVIILWWLWQKRQNWLSLAVFASGIGLACIGLLLPVWADDTVCIVWWGLAAIALGSKGEESNARKSTK